MSRPAVRGGIAAAVTAAALCVVAAPAEAYSGGTPGERETVCAQTLAVRTEPLGAWLGTLYQGQTFLVYRVSGQWVEGFAYGHINHRGWVQNGWFC